MTKSRETADLNNGLDVDASGSVGIGTTSPTGSLDVARSGSHEVVFRTTSTGDPTLNLQADGTNNGKISYVRATEGLTFSNGGSERMRIDSSGSVLVGTTVVGIAGGTAQGINLLGQFGAIEASRPNNASLYLNRVTSDGDIVVFRKNGSAVGSIGCASGDLYLSGTAAGVKVYGAGILACNSSGANADNQFDVGASTVRWDDIYATNGTIQTSDRNEKQDIEALTATEMLVAARISGLFKTFRWIDSVADKGDDARTHTGVIAQDVQDAFAAEGLDAGDYAMFISGTWWETQTDVPAVEAVAGIEGVQAVEAVEYAESVEATYDVEGIELTPYVPEVQAVDAVIGVEAVEAVEAADAYTRTDTYDTLEEAPEGATKRTRLGVRYPELLAFVAAYSDQRFISIEARVAALEATQ